MPSPLTHTYPQMTTLKSYMTCNFDNAEAVDMFYLQVYRFDSVIWAGMFNGSSLSEDYEYSGNGEIGRIIADLRVGSTESLAEMIDDTIYGEWLVVTEVTEDDMDTPPPLENVPTTAATFVMDDIDNFLWGQTDESSQKTSA